MSATQQNGLTIRPATMSDLEQVVGVINAYSIGQTGVPRLTQNQLETFWTDATFNLETDTRVVVTREGKLAGYAGVYDGAPHVKLWARVRVHPDYTGQAVGTTLGRWVEERARQVIAEAPAGSRVVLHQTVPSVDEVASKRLRQQGYQMVRHFFRMLIEMDTPPPTPVLPTGITIRTFERERETRALVHAAREAFRDHWGNVESPFEEEYEEWVHWMDTDATFDPSLWFLAIDGDEIAGFALCFGTVAQGPEVGEVDMLGVRRPWRRRGIALALLHHAFGELYRRGKPRVVLGVDSQSLTGALRLYERAGMHVQLQYDNYELELRPGTDLSTRTLEE